MTIMTSLGEMDVAQLRKVVQVIDNDNERTTITEYYLADVAVHRSVHVILKRASATAQLLCGSL